MQHCVCLPCCSDHLAAPYRQLIINLTKLWKGVKLFPSKLIYHIWPYSTVAENTIPLQSTFPVMTQFTKPGTKTPFFSHKNHEINITYMHVPQPPMERLIFEILTLLRFSRDRPDFKMQHPNIPPTPLHDSYSEGLNLLQLTDLGLPRS